MKTNNTTTKISSKDACIRAHKIRRETGCSLAEAFKIAYGHNTHKTSWTRADLDQVFSDKVSELLRKGYMIHTDSMGGHQGEIAKIHFSKGGKLFILVMDRQSGSWDNKYRDKIEIRFGAASPKDWGTIWTDHMITSWSFSVVELSRNYYVDEETAEAANKLSSERAENRRSTSKEVTGKQYLKAVLAAVKLRKGYKSTKLADLEIVTYRLDNDGKRIYTVKLSNKTGCESRVIL